MTPATTRKALAGYLREEAAWRRQKAEEYSDDLRNEMWAGRLEALAVFLSELPADDARLVEIDRLWGRWGGGGDVFDASGEPGSAAVNLCTRPEVEGDAWLDEFVEAYAENVSWFAELSEERDDLVELASDPHPAVALPAVRRLRYFVDETERNAVLSAQTAGYSWARIARILGRSPQTVWEKYKTS